MSNKTEIFDRVLELIKTKDISDPTAREMRGYSSCDVYKLTSETKLVSDLSGSGGCVCVMHNNEEIAKFGGYRPKGMERKPDGLDLLDAIRENKRRKEESAKSDFLRG